MNSILTLGTALWLCLVFALTLFYFGFGVTWLLLPVGLRVWRVWAMPFVGMALIIVWDYLALFLGFNLTVGTVALAVVVSGLNLIVLVRLGVARRGARTNERATTNEQASTRHRPYGDNAIAIGAVAIAGLTFLVGIAPLLRYGYVTIIGENWDYEFYLALGDYLKTFTMEQLASAPSNPLLPVVTGLFIGRVPMGFTYLQTTLDVLWRVEAFDSFTILIAFVRALGVVACYPFFRFTLRMSARAALFAVALCGASGLLLWTTYWGFGLQLTSFALLPVALAFGAHVLMQRDWRALPLAALLLAALNVTYHPTFVATLLPFGLIGLYVLVTQLKRAMTIGLGAGLLGLTLVLSFPVLFRIPDIVREFYELVRLGFGVREFIPLSDGLGFSLYTLNLVVGQTIGTPWLFALLVRAWDVTALPLTIIALGLMGVALVRLWRQPERRAVWYLVGGAYLLYLLILRVPLFHPYPYGFIKALSLVIFIAVALVAEGIAALPEILPARLSKRGAQWLQYALAAALLAASLLTMLGMLEQYFKPAPPFFGAEDVRLRQAARMLPAGATMFLTDRAEVQGLPMGLAANLFRNFPLYGQVKTGYGRMDNARAGEVYDYALLARGEDPTARGYQETALWSNQKFGMYAREPGVIYQRTLNASVSGPEPLTLGVGAIEIVTGTNVADTQAVTRDVTLALAAFEPETVELNVGGQVTPVKLEAGLTLYTLPALELPTHLSISIGGGDDSASPVFVPGVALREPDEEGARGEFTQVPTDAVLVDCPPLTELTRAVRCLIANPSGAELKWDFVIRGLPKGTFDDQELRRVSVTAAPRMSFESDGETFMQFDDMPRYSIAPVLLPPGKYRAALEVFKGDVLVGRVDLYNFVTAEEGIVERTAPPASVPVILKP